MTVFVVMEMIRGIVNSTNVFLRPESARQAEARWLDNQGIKDEDDREMKARNGMEFLVLECELKP